MDGLRYGREANGNRFIMPISKKWDLSAAAARVIPLWGVLLATLALGRAAESVLVRFNHSLSVSLLPYEVLGLVHDIRAGMLLGAVLTVLYFALFSFSRAAAFWTFVGGISIVGLVQLGLAYYFAITLHPLGRDLWGYSPTEILDTIQASGTIGIDTTAVALLLVGIVVGLSLVSSGFSSPIWIGYVGGGFVIVAVFVQPPNPGAARPSAQFLSTNKTMYLLKESSGAYFSSSGPQEQSRLATASQGTTALQDSVGRPYPWMYKPDYEDVLGPFFEIPDSASDTRQPPNIVFIVFEGLGTTFVGEENAYGGFTPFVDSLSEESLYWPNVLSMTGRTFGLMPGLFGSLPYADRGFMEMGPDMPAHRTLIDLLAKRGYHTSYFSGFDLSFDNVDQFLHRQGLDRTIGRDALHRLHGDDPGVGERYWGYPDKELFERATSIMDTVSRRPRLSVFHTLQTHDPFAVPNAERYDRRFERRLGRMDVTNERETRYRTYRDELTAFLYTDDALRQFFDWYRARPDFENTLFIILGDHRLIPIPHPSQIARYHIPLLLYSPLLRESKTFRSVSTLADVAPTLLGFLTEQYGVRGLQRSHWLGTPIDTTRRFRSTRSIPLMRNKNQLVDYLHKEHYLAGDQLYRLGDGLRLAPVTDAEKQRELQRRLDRFKTINRYVTQEDQLYSPTVPSKSLPSTIPLRAASTAPPDEPARTSVDAAVARIEQNDLSPPDQFQMARQHAFDGRYNVARAIAKQLLQTHPDYHDVRLLLGRTHAWSNDFDRARRAFHEVLRRDSSYADAYNALADTELWAERPEMALKAASQGLKYHPDRPDFLVKKAKALLALVRTEAAQAVVSDLERTDPDNPALSTLKERLNP